MPFLTIPGSYNQVPVIPIFLIHGISECVTGIFSRVIICDSIQDSVALGRRWWGTMLRGWAGWGAEHTHGLCAPFPLFCFPAPRKVRNGNCEWECEGKLIRRSRDEVGRDGGIIRSGIVYYYFILTNFWRCHGFNTTTINTISKSSKYTIVYLLVRQLGLGQPPLAF